MSEKTTRAMRKVQQEAMIADLSRKVGRYQKFVEKASNGMEALARKINELRAEYSRSRFGIDETLATRTRHDLIIYENALELVSQVERTNPDFERILEAAK